MANYRDYREYQQMLGNRLQQYRIHAGMTQQELEERSDVSIRSISRLEQGASVSLENFIRILSALNLADNLTLLIPDQTQRPSYYLKAKPSPRKRAGRKPKNSQPFQWGDENK